MLSVMVSGTWVAGIVKTGSDRVSWPVENSTLGAPASSMVMVKVAGVPRLIFAFEKVLLFSVKVCESEGSIVNSMVLLPLAA